MSSNNLPCLSVAEQSKLNWPAGKSSTCGGWTDEKKQSQSQHTDHPSYWKSNILIHTHFAWNQNYIWWCVRSFPDAFFSPLHSILSQQHLEISNWVTVTTTGYGWYLFSCGEPGATRIPHSSHSKQISDCWWLCTRTLHAHKEYVCVRVCVHAFAITICKWWEDSVSTAKK